MTKKRSTKRALLMSALSLLLCVSMLVGSTFAWFTDSVTSGRNTIQSGNLDIKLEYSVQKNGEWTPYAEVTSSTNIFGYDNWEPGYVAIAKFRVTNAGSLALKYQLTADVYEETPGVNVAGESFLLSNYLYTEVVAADATRDQILASTTGKRLKAPVNGAVNTDLIVKAKALDANAAPDEVAMAIWMPTTVGNEANHNGTAPSITFGINLIATQQTAETDSFNNQYDKDATYPLVAWGSAPIDPAAPFTSFDLLRANGGKAGYAEIPAAALDTTKENVAIKVAETTTDPNVTIADGKTAKSYEVTATGIKNGLTEKIIKVTMNVGTGYTGWQLFHNNVNITNDATYDATTGNVTFFTNSFSPYTFVYDAVTVDTEIEGGEGEGGEVEGGEEGGETQLPTPPKAVVTDANEFENMELGWTGWGGFNPASASQKLNSVYLFEAPHTSTTVQDCYYKDWECDYFVMAESETEGVLPAGSITLGGNYGGYGWVGFDNPEVNKNEWIPLLGSVMGGDSSDWTYADVVGLVKQFWCGVAVADGNTADLSDVTFVVELRLTNPEDPTQVLTVNQVKYEFATGTSTIPTVVFSAQELMDAIMSGNANVVLGGNLDLNDSIVVPGN